MKVLIKGVQRSGIAGVTACNHFELPCDCNDGQGCGCLGLCPQD